MMLSSSDLDILYVKMNSFCKCVSFFLWSEDVHLMQCFFVVEFVVPMT